MASRFRSEYSQPTANSKKFEDCAERYLEPSSPKQKPTELVNFGSPKEEPTMAYTDDELALLATTPQLIGSAVASAGSSGLIGTGKELFATASSVMKGVKTFPSNSLLKQLVPDPSGDRQQAMDQLKKFRDWGLAHLKQLGAGPP
jgi:hypothetical protein